MLAFDCGDYMMSNDKEDQSVPDHRFEALHALYENKQQWVRHYETMLGQINPISTTLSLGIAAFLAENAVDTKFDYAFLIVPAVLIIFTLWFNWWCDQEIRRQFDQIVIAESGMGFYEFRVDGAAVLPSEYKNSPKKTRPIILSGYVLQAVSTIALLAALSRSMGA